MSISIPLASIDRAQQFQSPIPIPMFRFRMRSKPMEESHSKPTFNVSFFDRTVDLAPFVLKVSTHELFAPMINCCLHSHAQATGDDVPLYPICRDWVRDGRQSDTDTLRMHLSREGAEAIDDEKGMETGVRRLPDPLPFKRDRSKAPC